MDYEIVIGLEVHCELKTKSKIFCSCKNEFGKEPNSDCCPVCSGFPGVLPVLNKQAVEYAIRAGLALDCEISRFSKFDRKNYYYPDLPKAYQISQLDLPLCKKGTLLFNMEGEERLVRINRIHLEEDAGKLVHSENGGGTLVDYNRCGVPLIEIVTEPDIRSPEEAILFLEALKSVLKYSGVSDCKMEQGSLRCDVNLSVRKRGSKGYGVRTEMKNINSFKAAYRAMKDEAIRQIDIVDGGGYISQETRRWDDSRGQSYVMRTKEDAHDYRYFPDPDLVPVVLSEQDIARIKDSIPKLPYPRQKFYMKQYALPRYDAELLTSERAYSDFFDETVLLFSKPKVISNWIMGDIMKKIKESGNETGAIPLSPADFAELLKLYDEAKISQNAAKIVFEEMWASGKKPMDIVREKNLLQISDDGALEALVKEIIAANPQPVADYKSGNKKALAFFVGQLMKQSKGKANPQKLNELLVSELEK